LDLIFGRNSHITSLEQIHLLGAQAADPLELLSSLEGGFMPLDPPRDLKDPL